MSNMPFSSTLRTLALLTLLTVNVGASGLTQDQQDLINAVKIGKEQQVKNLLKNKIGSITVNFLNAYELLYIACEKDQQGIAQALLDAGADINQTEKKYQYTSLGLTALRGNKKLVTWLLDNNANPNIPNTLNKETAIWHALEGGYYDIAGQLYLKNADLNTKATIYEWTLLHEAAHKNNLQMATWLIQHKANIHAQDKNGNTPLHLAIEEGKDEIAKLLVNKLVASKASLNIQEEDGKTPLHLAIEEGKDEIAILLVNKLVASKANLNIQEKYGMTPLHLAVEKKNYAVAALLVQGGANPDIQTRYSRTPREMAVSDQKMEGILNTKKNKGSSNANNQESLLNGGVSVDNILKNSPFKDGKQSPQGSFSKNDLNYLTDKSQISTQGSNQGGLQPSNTGNIKSMFANNSTQRMPPKNVLNQNNVLQGDLNKKKPINDLLNQDPTKTSLPQKALFALLVLVALGAICYFVAPKEENPEQHGQRASQEAPYQAVTT